MAMKAGFYKHTSGKHYGKWEYWDGVQWAGTGVYNSKKEAKAAFNNAAQQVQAPIQQEQPIPQPRREQPHSGNSGFLPMQQAQQSNGSGFLPMPQPQQGQQGQQGGFQPLPPAQGQRQGTNYHKQPKKKAKWPFILLGVFLGIASITGIVLYILANRPAELVSNSAQAIERQVQAIKGTTTGTTDGSSTNALTKQDLEKKADEARKQGNKQQAEYYDSIAKNAPDASTQQQETVDYKAEALDIAKQMATGQCQQVLDTYKFKPEQFNCATVAAYDMSKTKPEDIKPEAMDLERSDMTGLISVRVKWGNDAGKQQGLYIQFSRDGGVAGLAGWVIPAA